MKHVNAKITVNGQKVAEDALLERHVSIMLQNKSDNVLNLLSEFNENGYMHLVYEYCADGDLFDIVENGTQLTMQDIQNYFSQIVAGLQCIHENGYAHRDLSLENILINENICKICDFGLVMKITQRSSVAVGKLNYMAPEVFSGQEYAPEAADMWSLGIILFMLLTGGALATEPSRSDPRFVFLQENGIRALLELWNMEENIPDSAVELLDGLLQIHPNQRLDMTDLINHEWIQMQVQSIHHVKKSKFANKFQWFVRH